MRPPAAAGYEVARSDHRKSCSCGASFSRAGRGCSCSALWLTRSSSGVEGGADAAASKPTASTPARRCVSRSVSRCRRVHVQSNKPRDPALIPTVLTIEPPAGVTVVEIGLPAAIDLKQEGQPQPLAVFERSSRIGVR